MLEAEARQRFQRGRAQSRPVVPISTRKAIGHVLSNTLMVCRPSGTTVGIVNALKIKLAPQMFWQLAAARGRKSCFPLVLR